MVFVFCRKKNKKILNEKTCFIYYLHLENSLKECHADKNQLINWKILNYQMIILKFWPSQFRCWFNGSFGGRAVVVAVLGKVVQPERALVVAATDHALPWKKRVV
jgi:hypothetical protein